MLLKTRRARVEGVALEGVAATPREPPVVRGVMSAEKSPSRPDTDVPTPVASPSASAAPVSEGASRSSPYSPSSRAATSEARGLNALLNELRIQLDIAASGASGTPQPADAARDDSGPPEGHRARISSRNRGHRRGTRHHSSDILRERRVNNGDCEPAWQWRKCAFSRCENVLSKKRLFLAFDTLTAVRMSLLAPPVSGLERLGGSPHRRTIDDRATARTRAPRAPRSPSTAFSTTPIRDFASSADESRRREVRGFVFLGPNTALSARSHATRLVRRAFPPDRNLDDVELMKGDAIVLWLFALAQKAAAESLAPSFPGWLAPVALDALSFLSFLVETGIIVSVWLGASAVVGAYDIKATGFDSEEGEMRNAVNGAAACWAAFCAPAFLGVTRARDSILFHDSPGGLDGGLVDGNGVVTPPNGFPVPLTLALVLLVMLSWRAYAKVIGLLGWWRAGRERSDGEDDQWAYLRNAQAAAACLALSASVADFVSRGGFDYEPF